MAEEMITITLAEYYQKLIKDQEWLECLNAAGIEQAYDIQEEVEADAKVAE